MQISKQTNKKLALHFVRPTCALSKHIHYALTSFFSAPLYTQPANYHCLRSKANRVNGSKRLMCLNIIHRSKQLRYITHLATWRLTAFFERSLGCGDAIQTTTKLAVDTQSDRNRITACHTSKVILSISSSNSIRTTSVRGHVTVGFTDQQQVVCSNIPNQMSDATQWLK